jgi:putative SOS response-associated peptidase YedK
MRYAGRGLVPWWWNKPLKQLPARFNARAESVADKPMFRDAFKRHRCIIPASGCYEWLERPDGRQPYYISGADGGVLSFGGLWDRRKNPETGERIASCTMQNSARYVAPARGVRALRSPCCFRAG